MTGHPEFLNLRHIESRKKNVSVCNIKLYDNSLQLQNNQSKILGIFNASVERYPDVS